MVNFSPLTAEIGSGIWGTTANFNRFRVLAALLHSILVLGVSQECRAACSNAAETRNPLKFAGVPQTHKQISSASEPKFTTVWGHVEEILMLNNFFSDCRYVP